MGSPTVKEKKKEVHWMLARATVSQFDALAAQLGSKEAALSALLRHDRETKLQIAEAHARAAAERRASEEARARAATEKRVAVEVREQGKTHRLAMRHEVETSIIASRQILVDRELLLELTRQRGRTQPPQESPAPPEAACIPPKAP